LPLKLYPLPDYLRERLGEPVGRLVRDEETGSRAFLDELRRARFVVTVGDRITERIAELGRIPDVQVVDGRERRMKRKTPDVKFKSLIRVRNPAGSITDEALEGVSRAFKTRERPVRVLVEGEEDLLAIPAIDSSPIGASLYYGQPMVGVVLVRVDRRAKKRNRGILREMGISESG